MSKITEYLNDAIGYDSSGLPASAVQFTFGYTPFQIAETEDIADLTQIITVCQSDAIVDLKIVDEMLMVSFDFSNEPNTLVELSQELDGYNSQKDHVTESLNRLMEELYIAERNEDKQRIASIQTQIKSMNIPFMLPTIIPVEHGGTVQIGFAEDPKFVFFTSDQINQMPFKVTMVFNASDLFCQDEMGVYTEDTEAEILAQQEDAWYMEEAKKLEEEAYQAQFGYNNDPYSEQDTQVDKKLKGVRFK